MHRRVGAGSVINHKTWLSARRLTHQNAGFFPLRVGQRHIIISLSALAEPALAGAVIAKAPVAPPLRRGASPTPRRDACGARRLADADKGIAAYKGGQQHMIILTKTWLSHVLAEVSCITLSSQLTQSPYYSIFNF